MERASSTQGTPVALAELRSTEWHYLTFGLFWRSVLFSIIASLVGTIVSYAVAFGIFKAMGTPPDTVAYRRIAVPLTLVVGVGVAFLMFRLYTRWILTGRYGQLRLVVVRDTTVKHHVDAA